MSSDSPALERGRNLLATAVLTESIFGCNEEVGTKPPVIEDHGCRIGFDLAAVRIPLIETDQFRICRHLRSKNFGDPFGFEQIGDLVDNCISIEELDFRRRECRRRRHQVRTTIVDVDHGRLGFE
ncbi:MAG: hypothetical protein U5O39_09590 [Gammaproteobacteria bacterium]|nr:hypothetical protein [Gammaproteobacteria bacterium]